MHGDGRVIIDKSLQYNREVIYAHTQTSTHEKILAFQKKQAKETMPKLLEDCQAKDSERSNHRYDVTGKMMILT